ncbi:MAG: hypothetical protein GTO41_13565 [Burkholderiales bacterium]|nr:hypothetical protein [Burkholderiales bacterium]
MMSTLQHNSVIGDPARTSCLIVADGWIPIRQNGDTGLAFVMGSEFGSTRDMAIDRACNGSSAFNERHPVIRYDRVTLRIDREVAS